MKPQEVKRDAHFLDVVVALRVCKGIMPASVVGHVGRRISVFAATEIGQLTRNEKSFSKRWRCSDLVKTISLVVMLDDLLQPPWKRV